MLQRSSTVPTVYRRTETYAPVASPKSRKPVTGSTRTDLTVLANLPKVPSHLGEAGKQLWRVVCQTWEQAGGLQTIDLFALEECAEMYDLYKEALDLYKDSPIATDAHGVSKRNPYLADALKLWQVVNELFQQFGLSPKARMLLKKGGALDANGDEDDEFA